VQNNIESSVHDFWEEGPNPIIKVGIEEGNAWREQDEK